MAKELQFSSGILITAENPNDVAGYAPGVPTTDQVLLAFLPTRAFTLPINLTGSRGKASVAATASTTFSIKKNGTEVGTMVFAAAATTATFTMGSATSFADTDELTVVAPNSPDATLSDVRFTLKGSR